MNNMKIEIELEQVESLKREITYLEKKNEEVEKKLKEYDLNQLESKAIRLATRLTEKYLTAICSKLGFSSSYGGNVEFSNLNHWVGKKWYEEDKKFEVKLSATLTEQLRYAFIKIGVNRIEKVEEENLMAEV
jgi:hypothetical protein